MKKVLSIFGILLISTVSSITFPQNNELLAAKGCCKMRASTKGRWEKKTRVSINDCKEKNKKKDGDRLSKKSGIVWWDVKCR